MNDLNSFNIRHLSIPEGIATLPKSRGHANPRRPISLPSAGVGVV